LITKFKEKLASKERHRESSVLQQPTVIKTEVVKVLSKPLKIESNFQAVPLVTKTPEILFSPKSNVQSPIENQSLKPHLPPVKKPEKPAERRLNSTARHVKDGKYLKVQGFQSTMDSFYVNRARFKRQLITTNTLGTSCYDASQPSSP
jgi:hypothetical protein